MGLSNLRSGIEHFLCVKLLSSVVSVNFVKKNLVCKLFWSVLIDPGTAWYGEDPLSLLLESKCEEMHVPICWSCFGFLPIKGILIWYTGVDCLILLFSIPLPATPSQKGSCQTIVPLLFCMLTEGLLKISATKSIEPSSENLNSKCCL